MDTLTALEKDKIANKFNTDPVLVEAVRKVMLSAMYENGVLRKEVASNPLKNAAFGLVQLTQQGGVVSNSDLGEDLRGLFEGIRQMELGFNKLSTIKAEESGVETPYINPGI
jgi:hypothetical protein